MPNKRFTPEQIIGKFRHADILLGQGKKVVEMVKVLGFTDVTSYRWHQESACTNITGGPIDGGGP
jgi:hypothetical protein